MGWSRRRFVGALGLAGASAAVFLSGYASASFRETVRLSWIRVGRSAAVAATRYGRLEYAVAGRGKPLLMLHGTGGGFDQGLVFGAGLAAAGFQVIAPSRFGYLGSDFPDDISPETQADALVDLLDALGIERLPVAGGSAGALPAAYFALRHPDRCSHLALLVPAMNLTGRDPVVFTALQRIAVGRLLSSDLWFWLALRSAPDFLMRTLLATDPALIDRVSPAERLRAAAILNGLMPISARTRGTLYDGAVAGRPDPIDLGAIRPPMLVISAEDDLFGTAGTARIIAARVASARVLFLPDGGHIWLGHDDEVTAEIAAFAGVA